MLIRRSTLFVPANIPTFVEKAHTRGADAICLDLEDSVLPEKKAEARDALARAIPSVGRDGADVLVRINRQWELAYADLDAAVVPGVTCIVVPKVESPEDIYAIDRLIEEREVRQDMPRRSVQIAVKLETARGLLQDVAIAQASPRVCSLSAGTEDFATDLGVELTEEGWELFYSRARVVVVARAYGLEPLNLLGRTSDYRDLHAFRESALRARRLGFSGASCIHPSQVPVLNEVFSPTSAEIEGAHRLLEEAARAEAAARGAFESGGRMADAPTVERAKRLLARAARIQQDGTMSMRA